MRIVVLPVAAFTAGALLLSYAVYGPPELPAVNLSIRPAAAKPDDPATNAKSQERSPQPTGPAQDERVVQLQDQVQRLKMQLDTLQAETNEQERDKLREPTPAPIAVTPPMKPTIVDKPKPKLTASEPADSANAVVERLRQSSPIDNQPIAVRQWLVSAKTAIANGHLADARRLLQQVQLEMVFRPAKQGSAINVTHALEALGNNDRAQSQFYITQTQNQLDALPRQKVSQLPPPEGGGLKE